MPRLYINVDIYGKSCKNAKPQAKPIAKLPKVMALKCPKSRSWLTVSIAKHVLLSMAMFQEARDAHASQQIPNPLAKRNLLPSVCRWNCSKIFCPRLEGGETQISCH